MDPLHLPDVSEFQPDVDWAAVAAHNGGAAIIRALYGTGHVDGAWYGGARRADAHAKGIRVLGIYQYLTAQEAAAAQAAAFVRLVGRLAPGEFAVVDLEEGDGDQSARATAWLEAVDDGVGYPGYHGSWLYSGEAFLGEHGLLKLARAGRRLWVAAYGQAEPSVPHLLWQHTDAEEWPGIGRCDCSVFHGDVGALRDAVCAAAAE